MKIKDIKDKVKSIFSKILSKVKIILPKVLSKVKSILSSVVEFIKKNGTLIIIGIFLLVGFKMCVNNRKYLREIDRLNSTLYDTEQVVETKKLIINDLEQNVFTSNAQVVSSQKVIKQLESEKEYFRKLNINNLKSISKLELEIKILSKQGSYRDTIFINTNPSVATSDGIGNTTVDDVSISASGDTLRSAFWSDDWAWISAMLYPEKPVFNFGLYKSQVKVHIFYTGILKPKPIVAVTTPNPYINIVSANTIIVEEKKSFLQKRYPYIIGALIVGYGLGRVF